MNTPIRLLDVRTLGGFSLKFGEREITPQWPNDISKVLFCTLLSPLDEYTTMERLCRSLWDLPATRNPGRRIAAMLEHLSCFLTDLTGINPLIVNEDRVGIDYRYVRVDAAQFYTHANDGTRQLMLGNRRAALVNFHQADRLYRGQFLPGMHNRVISSTREELEETYQVVVARRAASGARLLRSAGARQVDELLTMMAA